MDNRTAPIHRFLDRADVAEVTQRESQGKPRDASSGPCRVHEGAYGAGLGKRQHLAQTASDEAGSPGDQDAARKHAELLSSPSISDAHLCVKIPARQGATK